jgi:hypothetical protein
MQLFMLYPNMSLNWKSNVYFMSKSAIHKEATLGKREGDLDQSSSTSQMFDE